MAKEEKHGATKQTNEDEEKSENKEPPWMPVRGKSKKARSREKKLLKKEEKKHRMEIQKQKSATRWADNEAKRKKEEEESCLLEEAVALAEQEESDIRDEEEQTSEEETEAEARERSQKHREKSIKIQEAKDKKAVEKRLLNANLLEQTTQEKQEEMREEEEWHERNKRVDKKMKALQKEKNALLKEKTSPKEKATPTKSTDETAGAHVEGKKIDGHKHLTRCSLMIKLEKGTMMEGWLMDTSEIAMNNIAEADIMLALSPCLARDLQGSSSLPIIMIIGGRDTIPKQNLGAFKRYFNCTNPDATGGEHCSLVALPHNCPFQEIMSETGCKLREMGVSLTQHDAQAPCVKGVGWLLYSAQAAEPACVKDLLMSLVNEHEHSKGPPQALIGLRWRKLKDHALTDASEGKKGN